MLLPIDKIAEYTQADYVVRPGSEDAEACGITWDSREVKPGFVYVALPGERVDGHDFAEGAVRSGAVAVLAMRELSEDALKAAREAGAAVLQVASTQQAFTDLARGWRGHLQGKVIALTGSMGKTTTKNLVRDVLSTTYKTTATKANQNNELGVPRTLLEADADTEFVVVEMGMRGRGQLESLCSFVKPDIALITNVGECHMELLGSKENIARAKAEVLEALPDGAGTAVLNAADGYSAQQRAWTKLDERGVKTLLFDGSGVCASGLPASELTAYATDVQLSEEGCPAFALHMPDGTFPCTLALRGAHNIHNACAAAALGWACGVSAEAVVAGLAASQAESGRQEVVRAASGITVINDAYNANPDSMCASLALLCAMKVEGRRFAVLGDMGELGAFTQEGHEKAGSFVASSTLDCLLCVGELSRYIAQAAVRDGFPEQQVHMMKSREEALAYLEEHMVPGDTVLVKASHSMELDRIAKGLLN